MPVLLVSRNPIQLAGASHPLTAALHTNRAGMVCERAAAGLAIREAIGGRANTGLSRLKHRSRSAKLVMLASETTAI